MADCACRCVDGDDLGMPEYAYSIATLDHECQVHNPHEYTGSIHGECLECGVGYVEHAVRHDFIPSHADDEGMVHCGSCGVAFDLHSGRRDLDKWNQNVLDAQVNSL